MKKPLIIAVSIFVLIIGLLIWWFSDTQVIKRQTENLVAAFTIQAEDGKAIRLSKNQTLSEILGSKFTCTINLKDYNTEQGKEELVSAHLYLGKICEASQVTITDFKITSITDKAATVKSHFHISVREKSGRSHSENAPAILEWIKTDTDQWKLISMVVETQK